MSSFQPGATAVQGPLAPKGRRPRLRLAGLAVLLGVAVAGVAGAAAASEDDPLAQKAVIETTGEVRQLRDWVLATADNRSQPFVIVDKLNARVVVFDRDGTMIDSAPVLLGLAPGDDSPAGIGARPLADIGPHERITPSGRFSAQLGENLGGKTVLWVDYDAAISLHPVVTTRASEQRQARLDSPTPSDNRVSYGCINVPAAFYSAVILPLFIPTDGLVYVLPETRSLDDEFFRGPSASLSVRLPDGNVNAGPGAT